MTDVSVLSSARRSSVTNGRRNSINNSNNEIKPVIKNQRRTSFTNNALIPDLNLFTDGPGVGKYSTNITLNSNPSFSIPKAERIINLNGSIESTPGHTWYPKKEKILGHYMSSDKSEQIKNQRRTSFCDNTQVPGLNIFTESPGVGQYSNVLVFGKQQMESNLENQPAYTIPKAERDIHKNTEQKTPGHSWYPRQEKILGHYSLGGRTKSKASIFMVNQGPSPLDYRPEISIDLIRKSTPSARIPTARRFSNNFF